MREYKTHFFLRTPMVGMATTICMRIVPRERVTLLREEVTCKECLTRKKGKVLGLFD